MRLRLIPIADQLLRGNHDAVCDDSLPDHPMNEVTAAVVLSVDGGLAASAHWYLLGRNQRGLSSAVLAQPGNRTPTSGLSSEARRPRERGIERRSGGPISYNISSRPTLTSAGQGRFCRGSRSLSVHRSLVKGIPRKLIGIRNHNRTVVGRLVDDGTVAELNGLAGLGVVLDDA